MKFANKFMVVPYEDKKKETENFKKSTDAKITDIVNNNKLDQSDKVKLINELLIKNQQKYLTNIIPPANDNDESLNESYDNSNNQNSYFNQTNNQFNETFNKPRVSMLQDNPSNLPPKLKKTLKKLNETLNGYYHLPPAFSTRNESKSIENLNHFSLQKRKQRRDKQKVFRAFMDENPDPKTLAGTKVLEKVRDKELMQKKEKKKQLVDSNREILDKKGENKNTELNKKIIEKEGNLDETFHMDTHVKQNGNGWIYLKKKHGKSLY
jgi:hypothetical protein